MHNPALRIAMYSHDTMGLGHMRRNLLVAQSLQKELDVTILMISGAWEAGLFTLPSGVDCVTLPALRKEADGKYGSRRLQMSLKDLIELRSSTVDAILKAFRPDLLIVDKVPGGVAGELMPALRRLREDSQTRCVLGLRDILDGAESVRQEWRQEDNDRIVDSMYDAVWVYGDRRTYDVVSEYGFSNRVSRKMNYTGYLNRRPATGPTQQQIQDVLSPLCLPEGKLALCMVGGGQDGGEVATAFAQAPLPEGMNALLLTGPFMPANLRERIVHLASAPSSRLRVMEFTNDTAPLLAAADRVVCMGGYNTICEVLSYRLRALVVPRVRPRDEQLVRARRFESLGLLDVLHPDELSSHAIARWLEADPLPSRPRLEIDFNGTRRLPELVRSLCEPARPHLELLSKGSASHAVG